MKSGKPSEAILARSVLLELNRDEAAPVSRMKQLDYGSFSEKDTQIVLSAQVSMRPSMEPARYAVCSAVNNIACSGAVPTGIMLTILFPAERSEQELRVLVKEANRACEELKVSVLGGHTEILKEIKEPLVMVTAAGTVKRENLILSGGAKPRQAVVMTKWAGLAGTAILAKKKRDILLERYAAPFLDKAELFDEEMSAISIVEDARIAAEAGATALHDVSQGGVYGALWELANRSNVGVEIDLKAIPIRQETIEICEKLDVNPYKLYGMGSLLIATSRGEELVEKLAQSGISSAVIGYTTAGKERVLFSGEEKRYLETPQSDELLPFRS